MQYFGEILSVGVAISWTATALFAEVGSKRLGSLQLNVIRMSLPAFFGNHIVVVYRFASTNIC